MNFSVSDLKYFTAAYVSFSVKVTSLTSPLLLYTIFLFNYWIWQCTICYFRLVYLEKKNDIVWNARKFLIYKIMYHFSIPKHK